MRTNLNPLPPTQPPILNAAERKARLDRMIEEDVTRLSPEEINFFLEEAVRQAKKRTLDDSSAGASSAR